MENYKIIIVKLARPDVSNGAKMFSRLMGIPEEKCLNLIQMMPFVLFEVENYAIARKLRGLLAPMEPLGFPILISLEAGLISKVNWPKNIRVNGLVVQDIIDSVPEFVNLMNHCPSCGLELRYQISLRIENESVKFPLDKKSLNVKNDKTSHMIDADESDEVVEMEEIEELTEQDETSGSFPSVSDEFVAQAVEAEDIDPEIAPDMFEDLYEGESVDVLPKGNRKKTPEMPVDEFDINDTDYGLMGNFEQDESFGKKGDHHLAIGVIHNLNDKIKASKLLSEILSIAESEALHKVKKPGDIIIPNITLEEAKVYKKMFEQRNLNVKITS